MISVIKSLNNLIQKKFIQILTVIKMSEFVEQTVCKTTDLQNNEKKVYELGDYGKVLLIKQNDKFSALGTKCSHYGAPLVNGVVYSGHISCPWHGACFNITNGDIEDFPGCDSLPSYQVIVKGSDVVVKAKKADLKSNIRAKTLSARNTNNGSTFVIVGGGASGFQCAETLRQEGFDGRIVLISGEDSHPYDRTKLSKALSTKVKDLLLRSEDHLRQANIEVLLNTTVKQLDTKANLVKLDNGSVLKYDKIYLSSGVSPKKCEAQGSTLKNIYYLKTHNDANLIAEKADKKNVSIIGTSFIGMEVAAFLNGKAKSISIIGRSKYPFACSLGQEIGEQIKKHYESKGIKFYTECGVQEFRGVNNELKEVVLSTKEVISTDLCVIGIGSEPNVDYLKNTDIKMENNLVLVNSSFETSVKNVFAGGDIVRYPLNVLDNIIVNVGHWQTAQSHGKFAALQMLGKSSAFKSVPFFWAMLLGKGLRFAGNNDEFKNVIIDGDLAELKFVAYYANSSGRITAVATIANDPIAPLFAASLRNGVVLTETDIKSDPKKWIKSMTD